MTSAAFNQIVELPDGDCADFQLSLRSPRAVPEDQADFAVFEIKLVMGENLGGMVYENRREIAYNVMQALSRQINDIGISPDAYTLSDVFLTDKTPR